MTCSQPPIPVGAIKSFGPLGPKYQVGRALYPLESGDWMIEITLVETGEKTEYRLTRLIGDPEQDWKSLWIENKIAHG
ncbi:DUF5397 domain-containing protein [Methylobacterium nodulans]|uniref:Uncharacterized protein n=1 Tax=Methylobacterium nodulans (strain LMG 21967 / CNCM I-2342 / ORS 2060) TaxID=460265 RepID=B8IKH0_METNO|nr:DUF5397 domain-containing protein [Methylobacterium nodulans]ACL61955.1 hypothetical protein Mnod_7216 [Methylobacterium nodulans ORS 2060]